MPLFEFECTSCQHRFEELRRASDPTVPECPVCHETQVRKMVSAGAIRANSSTGGGNSVAAPSCSIGGG